MRRLAWFTWLPVFAGAFVALYANVWIGLALWAVGVVAQVAVFQEARTHPLQSHSD